MERKGKEKKGNDMKEIGKKKKKKQKFNFLPFLLISLLFLSSF